MMLAKMDINLQGDTFTDELHSDVGSVAFRLNHDWFIDLVINTATGGGGTQLVLDTDYKLSVEDTNLSVRVSDELGESKNVWGKVQIINGAYQTGDLYFSGKYIADSVEAKDVLPPNILVVDDADHTIQDNDDFDEIWMEPKTGDRTCNFSSATTGIRKITVRNIGDGTYKVDAGGINLVSADDWVTKISDGTAWKIIGLYTSYSTGWINTDDWTNRHLGTTAAPKNTDSNVVHNLNVPLRKLKVRILISTNGTDATSFERAGTDYSSSTLDQSLGLSVYHVDNNNIKVQTGAEGVGVTADDGTINNINTEDWYYNIITERIAA